MTNELKQRLEDMADRGEWRGADSIMTAARWDAEQPSMGSSLVTGPRYGWAIALGAAALVLILIGGVAWWSAVAQYEEPVVDEPVTTTAPEVAPTTAAVVPVPTTVPDVVPATTVPSASPLSWTRIDDESFADTAISQVIPAGPGLIATGVADADPSYEEVQEVLAVWLSTDGTSWERIDARAFDGDPSSDCGGGSPNSVAAGPLGIIIVGDDCGGGAAWISQDGRTWTEVVPDAWSDNPMAAERVVAGGPGWVVVGGDGHGNGVVWVSPDGVEWTASGDEDFTSEEGGSRIDLWSVATLGEELVVLGAEGFFDSHQAETFPKPQALAWISSDGLEWDRLPVATIDHDGMLLGPTTVDGGERLAAFSPPTKTVPDWRLWMSIDGVTWTSAALPDLPGYSMGDSVVWDGDTVVTATGLLSSDGGTTWIDAGEDIPGPGRAFVPPSITMLGDRFIVGGYEPGVLARAGWGESGGSISVVWIGEWIEEEGS